jgi:hypothetical protein
MTSQGPQISNVSQQIMANTNRVNTKIDELATTLEGLSLNKDIKEHINNQLAGIIRQVEEEKRKPNMKVKDLEPYEGEKGKLRSWLTAAHLNMENKGIEGEDAKIRFIGGHLKGKAWDWFEPILRERDTLPRASWSERAVRILGSYKEMKKALNQVFGDSDEKRTAAEKPQRLFQERSVTEYITNLTQRAFELLGSPSPPNVPLSSLALLHHPTCL